MSAGMHSVVPCTWGWHCAMCIAASHSLSTLLLILTFEQTTPMVLPTCWTGWSMRRSTPGEDTPSVVMHHGVSIPCV